MADEKELKMEVGDKGKRKAPEPSAGEGLPESGWTAQQVADWLRNNGYLPAMNELVEGEVNGKDLLGFTEAQLKEYSTSKPKASALYNELHPAEDERGT